MTAPHRRRALVTAIAAALILTPSLAGCDSIAGMISEATDGKVNVSVGSLPSGWPESVPVVEGDILAGGVVTGDDGTPSWNATVKSSGDGVFATAAADLVAAGYMQVPNPAEDAVDGITGGLFSNGTYTVVVAVSGSGDNVVVNYTVTTADLAQ